MFRSRENIQALCMLSGMILVFVQSARAQEINLSQQEVLSIAERIFRNECSGREENLIKWNHGEDFLSLGIGHFIWHPPGYSGPFDQSFPAYLGYAKAAGEKIPGWLATVPFPSCPWSSQEEFLNNRHDPKFSDLQQFINATKPRQAAFIIERLKTALQLILQNTPAQLQDQVRRQFARIAAAPGGIYALADYVNFKGLGIIPAERYNGEGWGLLQVLMEMRGEEDGRPAVEEFTAKARIALIRRATIAPPERRESRWLIGWLRRVDTYLDPQ